MPSGDTDELSDEDEGYTTTNEEEYFSADEGMEDIEEPPQHHPQAPQQGYGNVYIYGMILAAVTLLMPVLMPVMRIRDYCASNFGTGPVSSKRFH